MTKQEARRQLRLPAAGPLTAAEIKRAYRAAARLHHPDGGAEPDAAEFRRATEAARLLAESDSDTIDVNSATAADVADAVRTAFDELRENLRQYRPTPLLVSTDTEIRLCDVPPGATVVIGTNSVGDAVELRVVDAAGQPIPVRYER